MSPSTTSSTTPEAGWQLQGDAAQAYEEHLVRSIFDAMSRRLVEAAGVRPGDRVLDVACGTGVVARAAAAIVGSTGSVSGIDINPEMLATARQVARDFEPAIEFHHGDVADLPFKDATFDVVLCEEAVQFFGDRVGALREMRRVTTPGGRVAFSVLRSLEHHPVYAAFAAALGEHVGPEAQAMMSSPFALGDAETLRSATQEAGLEGIEIRIAINEERFPSVEEFVVGEAASSPLAGPLTEVDQERRDALLAAMKNVLAPHLDDAGLAFHNETHIVTARSAHVPRS